MITHTLLLDSHILIWVAFEPHRLKESAYRLIVDAENLIVSQASLIELSFKHMSGTLLYTPDNLYEAAEALQANILPIQMHHLGKMPDIKLAHKDPFDRLLIAQSETENMPLLTADITLLASAYNVIDAGQ